VGHNLLGKEIGLRARAVEETTQASREAKVVILKALRSLCEDFAAQIEVDAPEMAYEAYYKKGWEAGLFTEGERDGNQKRIRRVQLQATAAAAVCG